ncbi:MAG: hypothetical protein K6A23_00215 [Butyrivibrio sp.]|nr:hypothetical protein [Butyrivibrio sp.]
MSKNSDNSGLVKFIILIAMLAVVILGAYFIVNRSKDNTEEEIVLTAVQKITTIDLNTSYPPTPREVVDLYCQIMKVMYKEDYTDDEFYKMAAVLSGIFDDELLANQSNWPSGLATEVQNKKDGDYSISVYTIQPSSDIITKEVDGEEIAYVQASFAFRHGTTTENLNYLYILRKDSNSKWKILGWTTDSQE